MRLFSKSNVWAFSDGSKLQKANRELEPVLDLFILRRRSLRYYSATTFLGFGQPVAARVWSHGWEDQQVSPSENPGEGNGMKVIENEKLPRRTN